MKTVSSLMLCACFGIAQIASFAAVPVLKTVKAEGAGQGLARNGDFEQVRDGKPAEWQAAPQGFRLVEKQGRNGSRGIACVNNKSSDYAGASQSITLNQTSAAPLVVRGWSKAENVSGSSDNDYSIYVDMVYQDGSPLWGQTGNFRCGSHDWEQREFVIMPEKPVKQLTLYCLFRHHTGQVWFDDLFLTEVKAEGDAVLFQGQPMQLAKSSNRGANAPGYTISSKPPYPIQARFTIFSTKDGLELSLSDHGIAFLRYKDVDLAPPGTPSGFMARDVAANSDVYSLAGGTCPELGLSLKTEIHAQSDHLVIEGRISDLTGRDRAITLLFALPVEATGSLWGDDIRHTRLIEGRGEYANTVNVRCGATGTQSLYPLAAIYDRQMAMAMGIDMAQPAQYRLVYHAGLKQLLIAYDFGLVKESERFPQSADFRFVLYSFDAQGGFRAALQKYMQIFPEHFAVRSKEQGIWMPFTDVSTVQGWQDFGFKYHEGNNNVPWDDTHGVLSFRYTEPMTWWMTMKKEAPRSIAEAVKQRDQLAQGSNTTARAAQAAVSAGMFDETGQPALLFRDTPWCNGAVWSVNPNPHVPGTINGATVHWSESIKQRLYGPGAKGQPDGEYLDSLEGYVTTDLNFRREHFRYTTVSLTFAADTKHPALYKGLAVYEFTKWMAEDVHRMGKLMFANGVPYRYSYLCPWLDVLGTETDWMRQGKYVPASDTQMSLWRAMSGQKPYLLLMNTDYDAFTPEYVEKYFQRSLFYGMWPSMFSHNASENPYWKNPKWYNRDRPLFKKYLPLIKNIAQAGWQPVTDATCDNEKIFVERFGPDASGNVYLTFLNDTAVPQKGKLTISNRLVKSTPRSPVRELISGEALTASGAGWELSLQPQQAGVIALQ